MRRDIESLLEDYERGRISRRRLVAWLAALAAPALLRREPRAEAAEVAEAGPGATFSASRIDHLALRVTDVPRARDFYRRHLGLEPMGGCGDAQCFLRCGDDFLALFRDGTAGLDHFSFAVEGYRPDRAVEALRAAGLDPERHADRVYVRDPDGLQVQVSGG